MLITDKIRQAAGISNRAVVRQMLELDYLTRDNLDIAAVERFQDPRSGRYRFGALPFAHNQERHLDEILDYDIPELEKLGVQCIIDEDVTALIAYRYKTDSSLVDYIKEIVEANKKCDQESMYAPGLLTIAGLPDSGKTHLITTLRNRHSDITFFDTDSTRLFWFAKKLLDAEEKSSISHDENSRCQVPYSDAARYIFGLAFKTVGKILSQNQLVITTGLINAAAAEEIIFLNNPAISYEELIKLDVPDKPSVPYLIEELESAEEEGREPEGYPELFKVLNSLYKAVQARAQYFGIHGQYEWNKCPEELNLSEIKFVGNPLMDKTALLEVIVGYANDFQAYERVRVYDKAMTAILTIGCEWRGMGTPEREDAIAANFNKIVERKRLPKTPPPTPNPETMPK